MKRSRRIKVWDFAKLQAVMLGLIGLICGLLYGFGGLLIDTLVSLGVLSPDTFYTQGLSMGTLLAMGAVIGMPMIFGGIGLALGLAEAVLFNVFSKWLGSVQKDLRTAKE